MSQRNHNTRSTAQSTQSSTRNTSSVKRSTRNASQASKTNTKNTSPTSQRTQQNDDDEYMTQSQATQSKDLTAEEENQLVGSVIRYLLAVDRTKHVIQRPQLVKNVFGTYNKHYRKIMTIVKATLTQVFGFNLVEFETGKYILTNAITMNPPHLSCPESEKPCRILLILVLAHIFMLDGICKEELLWDFLRKLTIIPADGFKTQMFGDVHKIITVEFVKQQYLKMPKIGSSDPPAYEFHWGVRAEEEVSKRHLLEFVSKMYNDRPIKSWPKQFNALNESECQSIESEDDN
ncbi:non-structural maintenance of chromosomes element 3 homolog isoform X1 [Neodiprion lecontei]|uniref:Non-structural maintenance of chromosomes element 3 homolog isoform X1 n=1 Tax=Neodiprion lecontei TaxID=441921 RepID=A0ABM3GQ54_NEOLC|nr:non-structural maintenance of chromosomes element 3 homolog isoform X1 [Neodiprion lecontei]XP_046602380.1 non-structural maintenance of chromosomes element 3 homolog isoform X1 [Neodiprion lecontei]